MSKTVAMGAIHTTPWRITGWTKAQADAMSDGEADAFDDVPHLSGLAPGSCAREAMGLLWSTSAMAKACCMFHVSRGEMDETFLAKDLDADAITIIANHLI